MRHSKDHVLRRRARVAELACEGKYQFEIAEDEGVQCSQQQVSSDLKILRQQWAASALVATDTVRGRELRVIAHVEREAWQSFARSRLASPHAGDPRWMSTILHCVERRASLLGLDKAKKYQIDFDSLDDSQLLRLANGESPAAVLFSPAPAQPSGMAEA